MVRSSDLAAFEKRGRHFPENRFTHIFDMNPMNQTIRSLPSEGREHESRHSHRPIISSIPRPGGAVHPTPAHGMGPSIRKSEPLRSQSSRLEGPEKNVATSQPSSEAHAGGANETVRQARPLFGLFQNTVKRSNMGLSGARLLLCLAAFLLPFSMGCSKSVEEQQRDLIVSIMTDGRWLVQNFVEQNTDISPEFAGYEFQFLANGTVQGIRGASVTEGTWSASASNFSITSSFPTGDATLKRLNDTWRITNNTLRFVEARPMDNLRNAYLKLVRK